MDKNKLKMKYHMGIWKELPAYPTEEDVVFELNSYLVRDGRPLRNKKRSKAEKPSIRSKPIPIIKNE